MVRDIGIFKSFDFYVHSVTYLGLTDGLESSYRLC